MRKREAGFTLIELLVSLLVLGLASAMLLAGVGVGNRAWERADRRAAIVDSVAAAQTVVRGKIERVLPATIYGTTPSSEVYGDAEKLLFTAVAPEAERPDAPADYRLSMSTGAELVLSTVSDVGFERAPRRRDLVLLRNVEAIQLGYFGAAPPDNIRRWRDRWAERPRPPELVRLRVRFPAGDPRLWPDLVIRPATTVDLNCVLNINTGGCKGR